MEWKQIRNMEDILIVKRDDENSIYKLDPVGSTVRYEMLKLCAGSV